jgi:hypothetical protein
MSGECHLAQRKQELADKYERLQRKGSSAEHMRKWREKVKKYRRQARQLCAECGHCQTGLAGMR